MTKKHYEAIAAIIGQAATYPKHNHLWMIREDLADYFATDNPKFNRTRFLQACGIELPDEKHPLANYSDCATVAQLKDPNSKHYSGCYYCGFTGR